MKTLILGIFSLTMISTAQANTGFRNGNSIDITNYSGWVRVRCMNGDFDRSYHCQAADYNPGAFDRFVTDQRVSADKVVLTAFHEDGSKKTKKEKFDANKGVSKKFNLLIRTLFQRPLLELGTNRVSYSMTKKRKEVARGEFEANVQMAGDLRCPDMWINDWGSTCDNASQACNTYFNRVTGCQ